MFAMQISIFALTLILVGNAFCQVELHSDGIGTILVAFCFLSQWTKHDCLLMSKHTCMAQFSFPIPYSLQLGREGYLLLECLLGSIFIQFGPLGSSWPALRIQPLHIHLLTSKHMYASLCAWCIFHVSDQLVNFGVELQFGNPQFGNLCLRLDGALTDAPTYSNFYHFTGFQFGKLSCISSHFVLPLQKCLYNILSKWAKFKYSKWDYIFNA